MINVALDTETWLIAPGRLAPKPVCVSFSGPRVSLMPPVAGRAAVLDMLTDPRVRLIGHNVAYDLGVLGNGDPGFLRVVFDAYDQDRIHCTKIYAKLWKIALGRSRYDHIRKTVPRYRLSDLVEEYLGVDITASKGPDAWRYRYRELDGVPIADWPPEAAEYAIDDAKLTLQVYERLSAEAPDLPDLGAQCRADWALHLASCWGWRTDPEAVDELEARLREHVEGAAEQLQAAGLIRPSGSKNMTAIREAVSAALGDATPTTSKGAVKTDTETLKSTKDPDLLKLAEISADQKELSTYIPILRSGTRLPINPRYGLVDSGRCSCARPNIQNQPRRPGVRECYIPRPGWVFVAIDYATAELRALAQILIDRYGSSAMAAAIKAGRDLHLVTAAAILGISYEEAEARHARKDKELKSTRQLAKAMNFGLPGGLGAARFVELAGAAPYNITITEERAKELKELWLDTYPEVRLYFRDIGALVSGSGGQFQAKHHRSGRLRGGVGYCDGCNTFFQGLVADGTKSAHYAASRECYVQAGSPLFGCRIPGNIHDELIMEAPEHRAHEAAERLAEIMIEQMQRFMPDLPVSVDVAMMRRWYKDAEEVRDDAGRLIPWEPEA